MPQETAKLLKQARTACMEDEFRKNNIIHLPRKGELIAAGDIHGHRRNFERIKSFADLGNNPERHVILQEVIHGGTQDKKNDCPSFRVLLDVFRYKIKFPNQVHIILGNHDTAFITNSDVLKNGKEMNKLMRNALKLRYEENFEMVIDAIRDTFLSLPLAVKCENGLWLSHSLPANRYLEQFGTDIFERELVKGDFIKPGSVYLLTWGRKQKPQTLEKLSEMLDAKFFLLGHQPNPQGWDYLGENAIIITSEHNQGCIVKLDLSAECSIERITKNIIKLASIK
jgi:hypothetical protein